MSTKQITMETTMQNIIKIDRNPKHFPFFVEYLETGYSRNDTWIEYRGFNSIGEAKEFIRQNIKLDYITK